MMEPGRVCRKLTGREAGRYCVIVDATDPRFVVIEGDVKRRRCNISHLEPTKHTIKVAAKADHNTVYAKLVELGLATRKVEKKKPAEKPKK